jgi:bifunctional pyridoxal-dependent enzyme with beta-cystathionase and maltose regulon repressor activities
VTVAAKPAMYLSWLDTSELTVEERVDRILAEISDGA